MIKWSAYPASFSFSNQIGSSSLFETKDITTQVLPLVYIYDYISLLNLADIVSWVYVMT